MGYVEFLDEYFLLSLTYKRKSVSWWETQLLNRYNNFLSASQKVFFVSGLRVAVLFTRKASQLNGSFTVTGRKGELDGKDYAATDPIFPFIFPFLDPVTVCRGDLVLETVCTYSEIMNELTYNNWTCAVMLRWVAVINGKVLLLKRFGKDLFKDLNVMDVLTVEVHIFDHIAEKGFYFGNPNFLV